MRTVILGSTLEGIRLALSLKGEGQDVLLVSQSTYFGEDLTATWAGYGVVSKKAWLGEIGALLPGFDGPLLAGRGTALYEPGDRTAPGCEGSARGAPGRQAGHHGRTLRPRI